MIALQVPSCLVVNHLVVYIVNDVTKIVIAIELEVKLIALKAREADGCIVHAVFVVV